MEQPMMPPPMMMISAWVGVVMGEDLHFARFGGGAGIIASSPAPPQPSVWSRRAWQAGLGNRGLARYISRPMTDAEMLRQIVAALGEGRADIAFSGRLESHMDFPGNSETDKTQFIIAGLLLIGLAY